MTYEHLVRNAIRVALIVLTMSASAMAEWKAANSEAAAAAKEPKIASVLEAVNEIDTALIKDDHAAFAALLAKDLVVNNPQNAVSIRGATGQRNASGLISYSSYVRSIEYAGMLGEMVLLMGDERVVPKGDSPMSGKEVRRRFTDVWKMEGGHWVLTARQATIVAP
jgi:ketosteroid isomerase-like protein